MKNNSLFQKIKEKKKDDVSIVERLEKTIYIYRYDIFAVAIIFIAIAIYAVNLINPGLVVFSDLDFPFYSKEYMDEIFGLWNFRWNTSAMLNIPRLVLILPAYGFAKVFGDRGDLMLKFFMFQQLFISGVSLYILAKRIISVYMGKRFNFVKIAGIITGSLLYALNPWVIFRLQHIYLLCGYSLFPIVVLYFFKVFDHKFQRLVIEGFNPFCTKLYRENYRDIIILGYITAISAAAIHYFFYTVLTFSILLPLYLIKYAWAYRNEKKLYIKRIILVFVKKISVFIIFFMLFGFYWFSVYVGSIILKVQPTQHNVNMIDTFVMFSRNSGLANVLEMTSYWWPMFDLQTLPKSFHIAFLIIFGIILVAIVTRVWKHNILLFITLISIVIGVFATGVKYPLMAPYFVKLTKLPILGNIFRDPNKLVGLLALNYSILFIFGVEQFNVWFSTKKRRVFYSYGMLIITALAVGFYIWPFRSLYIENFYEPVTEPSSYTELREYYKESGSESDYAVYLPLSETMLRPYSRVSTPFWNSYGDENNGVRATGDIHIYNSPVKTLFHHEGNSPNVSNYLHYMQYLLDQGRTNYFEDYISTLGSKSLIYHTEYIDQVDRQKFNKSVLNQQNLSLDFENEIFSIYNIDDSLERVSSTRIWTPYGLHKLEGYQKIENYHPLNMPAVFINSESKNPLDNIRNGDLLEVKNSEDYYLSMLPDEYYVYPFDWLDEGNPFLKWSKTYLSHPDWKWYMESLGINNNRFEFDRDKGVVVTFAENKLDLMPYMKEHVQGRLIVDFDTLLRAEKFFKPDNPELFQVQANPLTNENEVPVLKGEIVKGDPNQIWQVAKSGLLKANDKTPYQFNILVSGRDVSQFHVKARFYDAYENELGIQYVVAPEEVVQFDTIKFQGEFVSPAKTKYMRLDLLSFQRPERRNYWWIHDVELFDLSEYQAPNSIEDSYNANDAGWHKVYVRAFNSPKGGNLDIEINENHLSLQTKSIQETGFNWEEAGLIWMSKGENKIKLTNKTGFNAVNTILFLPEKISNKLRKAPSEAIKRTTVFMSLEGEIDFEYTDDIQSRRLSTRLSFGNGVWLSDGELITSFDIIKEGNYTIKPTMFFPYSHKGSVKIDLVNIETKDIVMSDTLNANKSTHYNQEAFFSDYRPLDYEYVYHPVKLPNALKFKVDKQVNTVYLSRGSYELKLDIQSEAESLIKIDQIRKFDSYEVVVPEFIEIEKQEDCSECEEIYENMMQDQLKDGILQIKYEPTCSCDWYVYTSPKVDAQENEEIRFSFDARSENLRKRHLKILFLDDDDRVVDTAYIQEIEEEDKVKWHSYEELIRIPEGVDSWMFQILTRGHKEKEGTFELKNLKVERYLDYICFDHVLIMEEAPEHIKNQGTVTNWNQEKSKFSFVLNNKTDEVVTVNTFLSPIPLWSINDKQLDYQLNSVTAGYDILDSGEYEGNIKLSTVYHFGLVLHIFSFIGSTYWVLKKKSLKGDDHAKKNSSRG